MSRKNRAKSNQTPVSNPKAGLLLQEPFRAQPKAQFNQQPKPQPKADTLPLRERIAIQFFEDEDGSCGDKEFKGVNGELFKSKQSYNRALDKSLKLSMRSDPISLLRESAERKQELIAKISQNTAEIKRVEADISTTLTNAKGFESEVLAFLHNADDIHGRIVRTIATVEQITNLHHHVAYGDLFGSGDDKPNLG